MSLEIKFNNEYGIVESIFSNNVTNEELLRETKECIALAKENNSTLFLCDASNGISRMSIIHVFNLEKIHVKDKLNRISKIAIIEPSSKESKKFVGFYETACLNRGWNVKIFPERQSALVWLLK